MVLAPFILALIAEDGVVAAFFWQDNKEPTSNIIAE
jgi:hypothetical protein